MQATLPQPRRLSSRLYKTSPEALVTRAIKNGVERLPLPERRADSTPWGPSFSIALPVFILPARRARTPVLISMQGKASKGRDVMMCPGFRVNHGAAISLTIHTLSMRRVHNFVQVLHNGCYAKWDCG